MNDDDLDAGYHQFELDASGLGSGVYFYKLESGSNVDKVDDAVKINGIREQPITGLKSAS